ncbi:PucR family transcriptional regulator [Nocardia thailandica]|uniref:PucR family transcriptional regulator n=1 Tax=Nocardia thailandica TaxID=257275 RepID=A0ABW6PN61_9NOCA
MSVNENGRRSAALRVLLAQRRAAVGERLQQHARATGEAAGLPGSYVGTEFAPTVAACARLYLDAMTSERPITRPDVARAIAPPAERHAEHRLPAATLLELVQAAARDCLAEASALATTPDQRSELADMGARLLDLAGHIGVVVLESYAVVERALFGSDRAARQELLAALLAGTAAEHAAARADIALADTYTVLAIDLGPDDAPAAPVAELVSRRRERVIDRALAELTGAPALLRFDGHSGTALLAGTADPVATDRFDQLARRLAPALDGAPYLGLIPAVARADLASAVADARDLAVFPRLRDRPPGCYRLDDLLLELQITRPGRAKQRLIQLLEPLAGHPHLITTLQAHLQHGADRQAAARELHVHPNTFTYRLNRITELTGLDPTQPREGRTLAAALTIHLLERPAPGDRAPATDPAPPR